MCETRVNAPRDEPCEGIGQPPKDEIMYSAATCPTCNGIRPVENGVMDYHTVLVIDMGEA